MNVAFLDARAGYFELQGELDTAWHRVMQSGRYILGEDVAAFENEFAAYCGASDCAGTGNGLDSLHLILRAFGIGTGDEVIVPANTFIATWLAVTQTGATPVPVEPDSATYNLDPSRLEAALTNRTRAVIAVHLYGQPADMTGIARFCRNHGLKLIEDAAQAHGAAYKGRRTGTLADAASFSFYPAKNLGAFGDGGAVVSNDSALIDEIRVLRNYGSRTKYNHETQGFNSRLDPLQAALLRVKLPRLDEWNQRRRRIAARYLNELSGIADLTLPTTLDSVNPSWHLFVVRTSKRCALRQYLTAAGIETMIHYPIPPHRSDAYNEHVSRSLPLTDQHAGTILSLPMGPHLQNNEVSSVIENVRRFFGASV